MLPEYFYAVRVNTKNTPARGRVYEKHGGTYMRIEEAVRQAKKWLKKGAKVKVFETQKLEWTEIQIDSSRE